MSDDEWNFKLTASEEYFYIENISKNKVLETLSDGTVSLEDFEEGKEGQLWYDEISYAPNARGYFILRHFKKLVLTPNGVNSLELLEPGASINLLLTGNISLMPKTFISYKTV